MSRIKEHIDKILYEINMLNDENHVTESDEFVAIKDTYAKSGRAAELLQRYGLTAKDIEQAVRGVIARK